MSVKIRLQRCGKKKNPQYRLVVMEECNPREGKVIEILGHYVPQAETVLSELKEERIKYWLQVGAQPTDVLRRLLGNAGHIEKTVKVPVNPGLSRKDKKAKEAAKK